MTLSTLLPGDAQELIQIWLRGTASCEPPCFWGITPGQTSIEEAENIYHHLGLPISRGTDKGKDFSSTRYVPEGGRFTISVVITVQEQIVHGMHIRIFRENQKGDFKPEWTAYSPETLIQHYGNPSNIELFFGFGPGPTPFTILMYFDQVNTIIEYAIEDLGLNRQICPLSDQFDHASLWLGNNPIYPPLPGEPLEKVTSMNIADFAALLTGNSDDACFIIDPNRFP
jgi:hypothetical protein